MRPITLLSNGVSNAPLVIYRISNGHISVTGRPIHFMFRSRVFGVGGSNSAISSSVKPKMAASLRFAARTSVSMQIYNGIARFTCESTCFLYYFLNLLITLINHTSWTRRPHSFISFITVHFPWNWSWSFCIAMQYSFESRRAIIIWLLVSCNHWWNSWTFSLYQKQDNISSDLWQMLTDFTLWRPLVPNWYNYKASNARPG